MHHVPNIDSMLLTPLQPDTLSTAVPDLIQFFEGLDATIATLSSSSSSSSFSSQTNMTTNRLPDTFPSPFTSLRKSLANGFNRPSTSDQSAPSGDRSTPGRSATFCSSTDKHRSASGSPSSALRGTKFNRRARTWNTSRSRSRSPQSIGSSHTNSPVVLSRRPSAIDLALLEEESLSHNVREVGLGLELMEPRPVVPVTVASIHSRDGSIGSIGSSSVDSRSSIFDAPIEEVEEEEDLEENDEVVEEQKQPFVMGGILEVMEGRS